MSMSEWAEREVQLACAREKALSEDKDEWDYGCACYESALKAYKSLCEDGHSGFSFGLTKQILIRLMDSLPLTPIEDTDDIWGERVSRERDYTTHQCKRMSSLFKDVYADGTVKYHDVNRFYCQDKDNPNNTYHSGLVSRVLNEMFPITTPYVPERPRAVICEEFLTDRKNGDFDTVGIYYIAGPERTEINRFFKEGMDDWVEISRAEYEERRLLDKILKGE